MSAPPPFLSVIIPNWNGIAHLPTCLHALRRQTWRDFDVCLVDNGSRDGSADLVTHEYPEVQVIRLERNVGFSAAVNEGIRLTDGALVALLNNDTEADEGWLAALAGAAERFPAHGFFASKIRLFDRRSAIHSAGDFYRRSGVPLNRGVWEEDGGQYDVEDEVFSACGGAAAYRRSMLDEIGLFDEDLFAFCEDVDLAFRAQLRGYKGIFVPSAIVYHRLSATGGGPLASYYCGRNFPTVLLKDMPGTLLRRHWRAILAAQCGYTWESLRHLREPAARARLRGQGAFLRQIPATWRKRRAIQRTRRASDEYIASILAP